MKAKKLIEILQKVPPNSEIVMPGYEGGYNDTIELEKIYHVFAKNEYQEDYYGDHEIMADCQDALSKKRKTFKGYILKSWKKYFWK